MEKIKTILTIYFLLLFTMACNAFSPPAQPSPTGVLIVEPTSPPTESNFPLTEADVPRVSLEEALMAYNSGTAIIVDVRSKETYKMSHIPGAVHIALGEFETRPEKIKLPKDQWIITYCT